MPRLRRKTEQIENHQQLLKLLKVILKVRCYFEKGMLRGKCDVILKIKCNLKNWIYH
jgi:hypothetical protein